MRVRKENYNSYLVIGLGFSLLLIAGLAFYTLSEPARLAKAEGQITGERVQRGGQIYDRQCIACHGVSGEGGLGPALNSKILLKNTMDRVFFSLIRSGVPNTQMPAWSVDYGGPLTDEDVRDVVAFIRAWEPTAPEIKPPVFTPDPGRGALEFANTCAICHGENGQGGKNAPKLNDPQRLKSFSDDWYREVIRNGRPAKGMPTWGTVLSPNQIEDLVVLIAAWRKGVPVQPQFSVADLLASAIFSLEQGDSGSAAVHVRHALEVAQGAGRVILINAGSQLDSGDAVGALATLKSLKEQWPMGDATSGAALFSTNCAPCHGMQGEGGIGKQLHPSQFIQSQSNAQIAQFIQAGRTGTAMAGFKDRLNESQIADIVAFLRLWEK